ncbi:hypothetical protein DCC39_10425 [Pueribacillus theae]|uniref:Uncharacterized protein n=1 Tax=Pueribacillus theae TaxID=2171751 RepID=A0A2U1K1H8_9BACI|nr:hypothetical protein [Pueribacillus theae]PWA11105.1 hypothetical protein DCC39_10425 [Pueribacillus theae]
MPTGGWATDSGLLDRFSGYVSHWSLLETMFLAMLIIGFFIIANIYMKLERERAENGNLRRKIRWLEEEIDELKEERLEKKGS